MIKIIPHRIWSDIHRLARTRQWQGLAGGVWEEEKARS